MPRIALVVITDGRDELLSRTIASLDRHVPGQFTQMILVDDSGRKTSPRLEGPTTRAQSRTRTIVVRHEQRQGLAAAIRSAWRKLDPAKYDYVLHMEDDCVFHEDVSLDDWVFPFTQNDRLAQVCLLRDPQSPEEHDAGGIIELHSRTSTPVWRKSGTHIWTEHDWFFSLQPCLYPPWVVALGWPEHGGEREFTDRILGHDPATRFAYLGDESTVPAYVHVGCGQRMVGWQL